MGFLSSLLSNFGNNQPSQSNIPTMDPINVTQAPQAVMDSYLSQQAQAQKAQQLAPQQQPVDFTPITATSATQSDASQSAPVDDNTDVDAITATAKKLPNYDNSKDLSAIQAVTQQYKQLQDSPNNPAYPTMLGTHGTLRNVLGHIGDAMLVAGGRNPQWVPAQQRYSEAQAMAGFQNDPKTAAGRVAALGTPNSAEFADKLYGQGVSQDIHLDQLHNLQQYRTAQTDARRDVGFQRAIPSLGAVMRNGTAGDWASRISQVDQTLKNRYGVDPTTGQPYYTHADAGIPENYDQTYSQYGGENAGQQGRDQNADNAHAQAGRDTDVNAASRRYSADTAAGSRASQPNIMTILGKLADIQDKGGTLSPAHQKIWDKYTNIPGRKGTAINPGLAVGGGQGGGGQQKFIPNQTYRDGNGNRAKYTPGHGPGGKDWTPVH